MRWGHGDSGVGRVERGYGGGVRMRESIGFGGAGLLFRAGSLDVICYRFGFDTEGLLDEGFVFQWGGICEDGERIVVWCRGTF